MDENLISSKLLDDLEAKVNTYESARSAKGVSTLAEKGNVCEVVLSILEPLVEEICKNATGKWKRICKLLKWAIKLIKKIC